MQEIFILPLLFNREIDFINAIIDDFHSTQFIYKFTLKKENFPEYRKNDILQVGEFYKKIVLPTKEKYKLPNLIAVTDLKILKGDRTFGSHFSVSRSVATLRVHQEDEIPFVKYGLLNLVVKMRARKYLDHSKKGCLLDIIPNPLNNEICPECKEELIKSGVSFEELDSFQNILDSIYAEVSDDVKNEMFCIYMLDVVGYSKKTDQEQKDIIYKLQNIINATSIIKKYRDELIFLPTGDGCAVAFNNRHEKALRSCIEVQQIAKKNDLKVRIGINIGHAFRYRDINKKINIAGMGINYTQRIMDCGDENHILANRTVYDQLANINSWLRSIFHYIGKIKVKHGVELDVYNIYDDEVSFGNKNLPSKLIN